MGYDNEGYRKAFGAAYPLTNFSFTLRVEAIFEVPLKSVKVITKNNNYERIKEGGLNDYVHLKRKPVEEAFTLQVERYLTYSVVDPLANGVELTAPLILQVYKTNGFSDSKGKADQNRGKIYVFTGCVVMGREYGALDSEKSGLATETITIGYKELFVLPNLNALGGDKPPHGDTTVSQATLTKNNADDLAQQKRIADSNAELAANAEKTALANKKREAQDNANKLNDADKIAESKKELAENESKTKTNNASREALDTANKKKDEKRITESQKELQENASKTKLNNAKRNLKNAENKLQDATKKSKAAVQAKKNKAADKKMRKADENRRKDLAKKTEENNKKRSGQTKSKKTIVPKKK